MKILAILIPWLVSIFYPIYGWAACSWTENTGKVDSPYNASDVQACITDAASKAGSVMIQIPNSTVSWSSGITVNMRSGWSNVTDLTIRGQNDCSLTHNNTPSFDYPTACGTEITNFNLNYAGKEGKAFRVAHLKVNGTSGILINGDSKSWRIDHIFWNDVTGVASNRIIQILNSTAGWQTAGVIDHCYFYYYYNESGSIPIMNFVWFDGGNKDWMGSLGLGTADAYYMENNKFYALNGNGTFFITDSGGASKYVIRYNALHNAATMAHDAISPGTRGARKWEIYGNNYTYDGGTNSTWVHAGRGGTGVFFSNTITEAHPGFDVQGSGQYIQFTTYRMYQQGGDPWQNLCGAASPTYTKACLNIAGGTLQHCHAETDCGGTNGVTNYCIDIDGAGTGSPLPLGYPCRDQLGVEGNNPQTSRPFLLWNNRINGNPIVVGISGPSANYIVEGRDYCLANTTMPSICNGVTTTYTPYSYPHPLTLPSPPRNLRILN